MKRLNPMRLLSPLAILATILLGVPAAIASDPVLPYALNVDSFQTGDYTVHMVDGRPETFWHSPHDITVNKLPHWVVCDFTKPVPIASILYQGRKDLNNGLVKAYAVYVSDDCRNWSQPVKEGELECVNTEQTIALPDGTRGRYLKFEMRSNYQNNAYGSCAEFRVNVPGFTTKPIVCLTWNPNDPASKNVLTEAQEQAAEIAKNGKQTATVLFPQTTADQLDFEAWRAMDGNPDSQYRINWQDRYHNHSFRPVKFALDLGKELIQLSAKGNSRPATKTGRL